MLEIRNLEIWDSVRQPRANPVPIAEPSTLALLAMGAFGLLGYAWRRRRQGARGA